MAGMCLAEEIVRLGETDPKLLVLEDAHWTDATALDLMMRLIDSIGAARLLLVVTARPEFAPPWVARPHASLLTLGRMGRADCTELVTSVAQGLSMETVAAIVAKTDGVPLFAEELAKSALETAGEDSAVPATLKDSLMARLDRLGEAREVAQVASVIGRQFARTLLEALMPERSADLDSALAKLAASGIVFPEGPGQAGGFSFKHALVRDAAYESLLLARRREWHAAVARALEERFPETAANAPELLAHHFAAARLAERGSDYRTCRRARGEPLRLQGGDRAFLGRARACADIDRQRGSQPPHVGFPAEFGSGDDGRAGHAERGS
jgi:predicted ATPase